MRRRIALAAIAVVLASCSTTGVVQLEKNRFMVSRTSAKFGFVNASKEKADVYRQANAYCSKLDKDVKTIKAEDRGSGFGRPAMASLEFECVPRGATE